MPGIIEPPKPNKLPNKAIHTNKIFGGVKDNTELKEILAKKGKKTKKTSGHGG